MWERPQRRDARDTEVPPIFTLRAVAASDNEMCPIPRLTPSNQFRQRGGLESIFQESTTPPHLPNRRMSARAHTNLRRKNSRNWLANAVRRAQFSSASAAA